MANSEHGSLHGQTTAVPDARRAQRRWRQDRWLSAAKGGLSVPVAALARGLGQSGRRPISVLPAGPLFAACPPDQNGPCDNPVACRPTPGNSAGEAPWRDRWGQSPGGNGRNSGTVVLRTQCRERPQLGLMLVCNEVARQSGRVSLISGSTTCCRSWQPGPARRTSSLNANPRAHPPGAADTSGAFGGTSRLALRA